MARQEHYDCGLNLKATELRLALPGNDEPEQTTSISTCSTSRKRFSLDDDCTAPSTKAQIIGWPPIQSYRKSTLQPKKDENPVNGSGLYVKVNMDGAPYLRKIDLRASKSYGELLNALEGIFKVKIGQSDYTSSYEDKDGDWMLVGDVPWEMFVLSCKRLRIIKTSEAKGSCI